MLIPCTGGLMFVVLYIVSIPKFEAAIQQLNFGLRDVRAITPLNIAASQDQSRHRTMPFFAPQHYKTLSNKKYLAQITFCPSTSLGPRPMHALRDCCSLIWEPDAPFPWFHPPYLIGALAERALLWSRW